MVVSTASGELWLRVLDVAFLINKEERVYRHRVIPAGTVPDFHVTWRNAVCRVRTLARVFLHRYLIIFEICSILTRETNDNGYHSFFSRIVRPMVCPLFRPIHPIGNVLSLRTENLSLCPATSDARLRSRHQSTPGNVIEVAVERNVVEPFGCGGFLGGCLATETSVRIVFMRTAEVRRMGMNLEGMPTLTHRGAFIQKLAGHHSSML